MNVLKEIMESQSQIVVPNSTTGTKTIYDLISGRGFNISRDGYFNGFRDLIEHLKQ